MGKTPGIRRRALTAALLLGAVGVGLPAVASAQEIEQRIIRGILEGVGLIDEDKPSIEYRERSPLVVPTTRELPQPAARDRVARNPAWPNDPDAEARRRAEAAARAPVGVLRPDERLTREELRRGNMPGANRVEQPIMRTPNDSTRDTLMPSELGFRGWGANPFASRPEVATFGGEPERQTLTQPPPGYMTPSPAHPYGLNRPPPPSTPSIWPWR